MSLHCVAIITHAIDPILSALLFMHVGDPHIPFFKFNEILLCIVLHDMALLTLFKDNPLHVLYITCRLEERWQSFQLIP